jgi:hypothetical protein
MARKENLYTESEVEQIVCWVADFGLGGLDPQPLFQVLAKLGDFEFFENVREHATRQRLPG